MLSVLKIDPFFTSYSNYLYRKGDINPIKNAESRQERVENIYNRVARLNHRQLCKRLGFNDTKQWKRHNPESCQRERKKTPKKHNLQF